MSDSFDVIVVGAGPAGETAAGRLAGGGLQVAIVERELVGGECAFWGCMPSKALLRPFQALDETGRVAGAREAVSGSVSATAVLERRDEVIHDLDDSDHTERLERKETIEVVRGTARVTGEREVTVDGRVLTAERAVILAPGTEALMPPIDGLQEVAAWTNREVTVADEIPARLLVFGGGPIGCEMAQAYATLGAQVILVESADRVIPGEEEFASAQVADGLREKGVSLHLGTRAERVWRDDAGVHAVLEDDTELVGDELLVAIGRRPRTEDLGLELVGVTPGEPVEVDERLRVEGHSWLHVIGDANGRALLTQAAKYQARVACDVILGSDQRVDPRIDRARNPRIVFTEPQVAAVGHTEQSAREAGVAIRIAEASTEGNAGGSFVGKGAAGTCRLIVDDRRDVIIGATFTGVEVAEWIHAATIAVVAETPLRTLYHAPPCFPTRSEVWSYLIERALG